MAKTKISKKVARDSNRQPTAAEMLSGGNRPRESDDPDQVTAFNEMLDWWPEAGDAPVGMLTDAQLGNRIRLICGRGYAAFVFPHKGQVFLRVVRPA